MPSASCRCGDVTISYDCDPVATALCHCLDCRKISGSSYGISILVPAAELKVRGSPSVFTSSADSGNDVTNHFCSKCGITLWADAPGAPLKFVKAGVLNDPEVLNASKPVMELYTCRRVNWLSPLEGVQQKENM